MIILDVLNNYTRMDVTRKNMEEIQLMSSDRKWMTKIHNLIHYFDIPITIYKVYNIQIPVPPHLRISSIHKTHIEHEVKVHLTIPFAYKDNT